ncbi:hypothetical protein [Bartonella bovis]|nr:hypothetical protein [Bartonella bovis]
MVMRCVFKHHVYLCVVSTALMAGLSLITSHTSKAYADQNCGSSGGVGTVKTIQHNDQPIVCDSRETRILSSTRGGKDININMDKHSGKAAVTVKDGANITILKKLKVTGGLKGGGLPVIKVLNKGQLTLVEEVDVEGVTGGMQKVIAVEGQGSSVTLKGVLKGFERVKINDGGAVTLLKDGVEIKKVEVNNGGTVRFDESVAFNNGEAGIKIEGTGKASVMGMGKTMTVTKGGGIQMDGTGTADVMGLTIMGSGMGVDVQNGREMTLNMVNVSGFRVGVNAQSGTVNINGESTITVKDGGTGIMVSGSGATVSMTQGKITGSRSGGTGVVMQNGREMTLTGVGISKFGKGVDVTGGTLKMMGGR